ncbi:flavodoxin domain-containing protein [Xanthomonas arboricola pv. corylina]|uniref:flavodoxin domain-containing protein n=1 Tax=Xanthomonas arboricola TaxID=56448 RepID=UPI000CEF1EF4|nr:flavodoxin domain-containing protein [Xanthomonas arboricola]MDN0202334.1 flavodoxin domain-containing protein [Xanthomonas arboricola pv. corylina]MDN0206558.1 flavodoxin domain-containing protein [Xanthomonas arboricola pv. corylina]MDN0210532.1 flavodoxin domain-containing protein [Xanthomonas arboricola pv. corylina]MDN0215143.1 flavodoxin domain-containing protein [Xanthomonas arboricola pv. corylina]PPU63640.1 sulfite reductase [Xanthomonas arboricola pv. corylina]
MSSAASRVWLGNGLVLLALAVIVGWLAGLHEGAWWSAPTPHRWQLATLGLALYLGLCVVVLPRARKRVGAQRADASGVLIVWASQTGFARELAQRSVAALQSAGVGAHALPIEAVDGDQLARVPRLLCIVSTTGEGDTPDHAQAAERDWLAGDAQDLTAVQYAVLALGDRGYAHFCAVGRRIDDHLQARGATRLFERIEVDNADPRALQQWQRRLTELAPALATQPDWSLPTCTTWQLRERVHVNPGSAGAPIYRLRLTPCDGALPQWSAGDIAEIAPHHAQDAVESWLRRNHYDGAQHIDGRPLRDWLGGAQLPIDTDAALGIDVGAGASLSDSAGAGAGADADADAEVRIDPTTDTGKGTDTATGTATGTGTTSPLGADALVRSLVTLPHRDYSLASIPEEGHAELLVREHRHADGSLGLGSGWLCAHAPIGAPIALRLRSNPGFHPPAPDQPMLLIGNGTGIAGLRAHLRARIAAGARRNWLLFGERNAAHDALYADELQQWQQDGWIERLDLVYSRDQPQPPHYVQHALAAAADRLRHWIDQDACIYVCGSLRGMAPELDHTLDSILGADVRQQLLRNGRYRRDVY